MGRCVALYAFYIIHIVCADLLLQSHGGANEAALKMLEEIGSVDNIPSFIEVCPLLKLSCSSIRRSYGM